MFLSFNFMYFLLMEGAGVGHNVGSDHSKTKISGVSCSERKAILFDRMA